jgi:hypothetical protein
VLIGFFLALLVLAIRVRGPFRVRFVPATYNQSGSNPSSFKAIAMARAVLYPTTRDDHSHKDSINE